MSEQNQTQQLKANQWVQEQYKKATKYLAEKGIVTKSVTSTESRYIVPAVAVWKLHATDNKSYWVISGDLPSDHIDLSAAANVRDAIRNFSMKWQMQAENIGRNAKDKTQHEFAQLLISRAEGLYKMFERDDLWANEKTNPIKQSS